MDLKKRSNGEYNLVKGNSMPLLFDSDRLRQAANDKYLNCGVSNFLQKLNLATKAPRHKRKMHSIFFVSCLGAFVATVFRSKAANKILLIVIIKELKKNYACLRLTALILLTKRH